MNSVYDFDWVILEIPLQNYIYVVNMPYWLHKILYFELLHMQQGIILSSPRW